MHSYFCRICLATLMFSLSGNRNSAHSVLSVRQWQTCAGHPDCYPAGHSICLAFLLCQTGHQPHTLAFGCPALIGCTSLVPDLGIRSPGLWFSDSFRYLSSSCYLLCYPLFGFLVAYPCLVPALLLELFYNLNLT